MARLGDLQTKNSTGKAVMTVPRGARPLAPTPLGDLAGTLLAAVTNEGYLLVFPAAEMAQLAKGKGVKILNIPKKRAGQERLLLVGTLAAGEALRVHAGKRYLTLAGGDLEGFRGVRALRGSRLPRGYQNVSALEAVR